MTSQSRLFVLTAVLAASVAMPAYADSAFNRIATFPVAENLPTDTDAKTPTSSEIIKASEDGKTLVYSDSPLGAVGFIDISDPKAPKAGGIVKIEGEPTSVFVIGDKVLAGVNTSESFTKPSGNLAVIDLATKKILAACDLGGQPDSVAVSADGKFAAVAIENERDEELNDGELPQLPAGDLKIFSLTDGMPDCATMKTVDLTGLAEIAPEDPEPEFVDFNAANEIVVTLQENNYIAIIDAATGKVFYEAGPSLEMKIAAAGHYPDKRNKKGVELEGLEVATFGDTQYIFVASERASMIGVYKDTGAEVFRYVGKANTDRCPFDTFAAKVAELSPKDPAPPNPFALPK
jgi:DNA-binding beta-propeller fold protein YncE